MEWTDYILYHVIRMIVMSYCMVECVCIHSCYLGGECISRFAVFHLWKWQKWSTDFSRFLSPACMAAHTEYMVDCEWDGESIYASLVRTYLSCRSDPCKEVPQSALGTHCCVEVLAVQMQPELRPNGKGLLCMYPNFMGVQSLSCQTFLLATSKP